MSKSLGKAAKHFRDKNLKNFLSVFCDWKFYPQGSRDVSCENLWVPSRLEPPTANKSLDWAARNNKNPNFEKYSKYFSWLGHWPASESQNFFVGTRDWGMRLDQPVTESPKQGSTIFFWKIWQFCKKTKDFPKTTKTLKIFLCLINKDWACENTFNLCLFQH